MTSCISTNCPRRATCKRHVVQGLTQGIDYSSTGSGGSNIPYQWDCGPLGHYALYQYIDITHDNEEVENLRNALRYFDVDLFDTYGVRKSNDKVFAEFVEAVYWKIKLS